MAQFWFVNKSHARVSIAYKNEAIIIEPNSISEKPLIWTQEIANGLSVMQKSCIYRYTYSLQEFARVNPPNANNTSKVRYELHFDKDKNLNIYKSYEHDDVKTLQIGGGFPASPSKAC